MESYILNVATQIIIQAIAAYGLNVIVGNAGQISLGHAAFVGIGAYSAAQEKATASKNQAQEDIDDIDEIFKIFNRN